MTGAYNYGEAGVTDRADLELWFRTVWLFLDENNAGEDVQDAFEALRVFGFAALSEPHSCPRPSALRKYRNRLWVCGCGRAWQAIRWENWAGGGWEWKAWPHP